MKHFKFYWLIAALCLFLITGLFAQEEKKNKWGGDAAIGLALARGNTDTTNLSFTFSATGPLSESIDSMNKAFFLLSKEKDITNAESMGVDSQIQWKHSEKFFPTMGFKV